MNTVFIFWLVDNDTRLQICEKLGLSQQLTVNGKTVVPISKLTMPVYDELVALSVKDKIRLTLEP